MKITKINPILDHILVSDMNFGEQVSTGGIVLRSDNGKSEGVKPRWGKVYAIGPDQKDVAVGEWILIEHGRWTRGIELDVGDDESKMEIFRIDPTGILLVSDTKPADLEFGAFSTPTRPGMSDFAI